MWAQRKVAMTVAASSAPPSILLVEDDEDVLLSLSEQLRDAGYAVDASADGKHAWDRLINGSRPSLIVLDLKLPGLSGWELLERLRSSTVLVGIPVVVVSAYLGFPPAGALAWLKKPVDPKQLLEVVERLVPS
jgi:CheY-like chemotaxis protein